MNYPYFLKQLRHFKYICGEAEVLSLSMLDEELNVQAAQLIALDLKHDPTRQFSANNPNFIYIGFSSQLPKDPSTLPRYCCCLEDAPLPEAYANGQLRCNLSLVRTKKNDLHTLLLLYNHVSFILADDFRYYRGVERLSKAESSRSSLEAVFHIICGLIVNPLLIINDKGEVLIGDHIDDFVDPSLKKSAQAGQLTKKQMNELRTWDVYTHLREDYYNVEDSFAWGVKDYICVPIKVRGIRVAELITQNLHSAFHYSTIRLMEPIIRLLGIVLDRQMEERNDRSLLHSLLFQELLHAKNAQEPEFRQRLEALRWRQEPGMLLLCCEGEEAGMLLLCCEGEEAAFTELRLQFPTARWTVNEHRWLLLLYPDPVRTDAQLEEILRQHGLRAGISWPFDDLMDLRYAYPQAEAALNLGPHTLTPYSYAFPAHITTIPVDLLRHYIHPAILRLEAYDATHEGSMLETLDAVLSSSDQLGSVAERLFIHRSTLFYRLGRIRELCDIDLANSEQRMNLLLSLRLLQGHGLLQA